MSFYAREFWRFVFVQQRVAALAQTAIEFPPMQEGRLVQPRGREGQDRRGDGGTPRAVGR